MHRLLESNSAAVPAHPRTTSLSALFSLTQRRASTSPPHSSLNSFDTGYSLVSYLRRVVFLDIVLFPNLIDCRGPQTVAKAASPKKSPKKSVRDEKSQFGKDRRRKHHHFLVTVNYADGETFGRVYTDKAKATRFADRQRRSPVVKSARVSQVS
jgi:hypothetical protein